METWQIIEKRWYEMEQENLVKIPYNPAANDILDLLDKIKGSQAEIEQLQAELDKYKRLAEQFRDDYYGAIQDTKIGEAVGSALVEQVKQKDEMIAALKAKLQVAYEVDESGA